jgi:hypothetical protein
MSTRDTIILGIFAVATFIIAIYSDNVARVMISMGSVCIGSILISRGYFTRYGYTIKGLPVYLLGGAGVIFGLIQLYRTLL